MKEIFMANTPMQLMNAAIIAYSKPSVQFDVYCTSNIIDKARKLEYENVFQKCYEINLLKERFSRDNIIGKTINRIQDAMRLDEIIDSLPSSPQDYSTIFISGVGMLNIEYYYAFKRVNKKIQLSLYEEGLFEYVGFSRKSISQNIFSKVFFGRYYLNDAKSLYVYNPESVQCAWANIELTQICNNIPKDLLQKLNTAFDYNDSVFHGCKNKCIVVEQEFYSGDDYAIKIQRQMIDIISSLMGKKNVVIKLHPRSKSNKYPGYMTIDNKAPLELIALNEDIGNNFFVSINSSAILNLPLMCHINSNIYILNNLVKEGRLTDEISQVVNTMNFRKVHVPSSLEEFKRQVKTAIANEEISEHIKD